MRITKARKYENTKKCREFREVHKEVRIQNAMNEFKWGTRKHEKNALEKLKGDDRTGSLVSRVMLALKLLNGFPTFPLLFVISYFRVFEILCRLSLRIPLAKRPVASYIN